MTEMLAEHRLPEMRKPSCRANSRSEMAPEARSSESQSGNRAPASITNFVGLIRAACVMEAGHDGVEARRSQAHVNFGKQGGSGPHVSEGILVGTGQQSRC